MTEPTLEDQLAGALNSIGLLQEALADVEASFAREDAGWTALGGRADQFTHKFRTARAADAVAAAAYDPLHKRAHHQRVAYIWAGGVQVSTRDDAEAGQDVNAVVRAFWGDEDVQQTFSSVQALIEHERKLGTHGELFLALPTDPRTGRSIMERTILIANTDDPVGNLKTTGTLGPWEAFAMETDSE